LRIFNVLLGYRLNFQIDEILRDYFQSFLLMKNLSFPAKRHENFRAQCGILQNVIPLHVLLGHQNHNVDGLQLPS